MYDVYNDLIWEERWARMRWWQKAAHVALWRVLPVAVLVLVLIAVFVAPRAERHLTRCCICTCESAKQ